MKRSIIPFAAAALILFGCQEKPEPVPEPEAKLEVSPASISFDSSASEKTITITATQDWKAAVEGEGFSISSSAGKGNAEVKVSAGANESLDARKGKVTITSGKLSAKVELSQAGEKPVILIEGNSVEVPAEGGRYEINVKYNTEYSFEIDQSAQDWLHCVGTRALQEGKIDFVVDENESANERTAKVTISGKKASDPVNTITFTQAGSTKDPVLPGEFSVGDGYTVHFSSGNLRAKKTYGIWNWGFYEHQYDYNSLNSSCIDGKRTPSSTDDEIDLFTWGYGYWSTDPTAMEYLEDYTADKEPFSSSEDWGAAIDDKGTWRTLSADEWKYLINEDGSNTIRKNKVKTGVTVCDHTNCIILVPDVCLNSYSFDSSKTSYSSEEWEVAEAAGLVCLPAAGMSSWEYTINGVGKNCNYWTSSSSFISSDHTGENSYYAHASKNGKFTCDKGGYRPLHYAVRLVTGAPAPPPAIVAVESVSIDRTEMTLAPSATGKLYATVLPENAADKSVTWTSSNTSVAAVNTEIDGSATIYTFTAGTTVITVTTGDGAKTASCTVTVEKKNDSALPGEFSVSGSKKVHFSKGNLFWDGDSFEFEADQNDFPAEWNGSHVGHFYWSKNASVASAKSYGESSTSSSDIFFTNSSAEKAHPDFTVAGEKGKYRILSKKEWEYLFNSRTVNGGKGNGKSFSLNITYESKMGIVLYPDNYKGEVLSGTISSLPDGVVFLSAAGYRYEMDIDNDYSCYWASDAGSSDLSYEVFFDSSQIYPDSDDDRSNGAAVRLVTDIN